MRRQPGFGRRLTLRWVHLLLGGALLMPYFLLVAVCMSVAFRDPGMLNDLVWQFTAYALCLPLVAATARLFPLVRVLERAAARALCSVPEGSLVTGAAAGAGGSRAERRRTAGWFTLHAGAGALVSGASLAVPPASAVLLVYPFVRQLRELNLPWAQGIPVWGAPPAGLALLVGLAALAYGAGALLDRWAPVLLGPTPADRLALAEQRAASLAARNRLARELHDSVGHALSAVTLQAGAARKVLGSDPEFAREALSAIEETTRGAVAELDTVLGVLREGDTSAARVPRPPTLAAGMESLLNRTRAAGVTVSCPYGGRAADGLPDHLSREAYRIVQEGLTNVLRHAGAVPVELTVAVENAAGVTAGVTAEDAPKGTELTVRMENPLPGGPAPEASRGGGRGLRGIEERAELLGGSAESGPREGSWRLCVRLPLRTGKAR
jgi:signal transduction histidine kinase